MRARDVLNRMRALQRAFDQAGTACRLTEDELRAALKVRGVDRDEQAELHTAACVQRVSNVAQRLLQRIEEDVTATDLTFLDELVTAVIGRILRGNGAM